MRKITYKKAIGLLGVLVLMACYGWQQLLAHSADWLLIKQIRIVGELQRVDPEKIQKVVMPRVIGGLYSVDIQQIRESVEQLTWVQSAKIKRVWPDTINIKIKEQQPIVRWRANSLLNNQGQIFRPSNINVFYHLPLLEGPIGSEKVLLTKMQAMSAMLKKQGMQLTELRVNERRAWKLKLDRQMEVKLGVNGIDKKFKRFLNSFALIGEAQMHKVAVVDLRYTNGYAIKWNTGEREIDWQHVVKMNKAIHKTTINQT